MTNLFSGWLKPQEHVWLCKQARGCNRVLEVGSYHGRSTSALLNAKKVWCVDLWGSRRGGYTIGEKDYQIFLKNIGPWMDRVEILRGDSHEMLDALTRTSEKFFDLAFIDGCHEYSFVHGDILRCLKLVRPGGVICGHDYNGSAWPGVVKAVDELVPGFERVRGTSLWWRRIE